MLVGAQKIKKPFLPTVLFRRRRPRTSESLVCPAANSHSSRRVLVGMPDARASDAGMDRGSGSGSGRTSTRHPVEAPSPVSSKHPLVSSLFWLWNRFSVQDPDKHVGEEQASSASPNSASSDGSKLGDLWQEELFGSHLGLYAEYFEELKKGDVESLKRLNTSGGGSPLHTPLSPSTWGWYVPMTPPNEARVFKPPPLRTLTVSADKGVPQSPDQVPDPLPCVPPNDR